MDTSDGAAKPSTMAELFATATRELVAAQCLLDDRGREAIRTWDEHGIPPTVWALSDVRIRLLLRVSCDDSRPELSRIYVHKPQTPQALVQLTARISYHPTPQDSEETV